MIPLRNTAQLGGNLFQRTRCSYFPGSFGDEPTRWCKAMFDAISPSDLIDDLCLLGSPEVRGENPSDTDLQRAAGSGRVVLSGSDNGTRIVDVFQRSPIRIMFPTSGGSAVEEAVLINTAGGIAAGDPLAFDFS